MAIGSDFFDLDQLGVEKFIGEVVQSCQKESDKDYNKGESVWYLEVKNLTREMKFNYSKNIPPKKGRNSAWVKVIKAFASVGDKLGPTNLESIQGKTYWFHLVDQEFQIEGETRSSRLFFPVSIATPEDLFNLNLEKQKAAAGESVEQSAAGPEDIEFAVQACARGVTFGGLLDDMNNMFPDVADKVNAALINRMVEQGKLSFDATTKQYTAVA